VVSKFIFWFSIFFILYSYLGYPLILFILSKLFPRPCKKNNEFSHPYVSVIVASNNEEGKIGRRVKNLLAQEYPPGRLEIIVVSDGSTDATETIVKQLAMEQTSGQASIFCYAYSPSKGKPTALNLGVQKARGEIIIFADSRQQFEKNTIPELVANFADPLIGGVSGELVFLEEGESRIKMQMGAYWKYEKLIRKLESKSGSVVGATGAIYAIRKHLYQPLPAETILDDVLTPLNIVFQGYRIVFDGQAVAYDFISQDVKQEWHRKVRTLSGNWQLVSISPLFRNSLHNFFFWRIFSHKFARLFVPFFLIALLLSSLLADGVIYSLVACGQIIFYLVSLLFLLVVPLRRNPILKLCYFFCLLNIAAFFSFFVWCSGRCGSSWKR